MSKKSQLSAMKYLALKKPNKFKISVDRYEDKVVYSLQNFKYVPKLGNTYDWYIIHEVVFHLNRYYNSIRVPIGTELIHL